MKLPVHLAQPLARDVRVDLRRPDVGVAEHELHGAQVGAAFDEVGGEGVAQGVRAQVLAHLGLHGAAGAGASRTPGGSWARRRG